jgi:hypothetical protein
MFAKTTRRGKFKKNSQPQISEFVQRVLWKLSMSSTCYIDDLITICEEQREEHTMQVRPAGHTCPPMEGLDEVCFNFL